MNNKDIILVLSVIMLQAAILQAGPSEDIYRQNAYSAGMKNACLAMSSEGITFVFDPALSSVARKNGVNACYSRLNADFNWMSVHWSHKKGIAGFGAALDLDSLDGGFERYSSDGTALGSAGFGVYRLCLNFSCSPVKQFQAGINGAMLHETIGVKDYTSFGADLGVRWQPATAFSWALVAQDLGAYDAAIKTGICLTVVPGTGSSAAKKKTVKSANDEALDGRAAFYSGMSGAAEDTNSANVGGKLDADIDSIYEDVVRNRKASASSSWNGRLNFETDYSMVLANPLDQVLNAGVELWFFPQLGLRSGVEYSIYRKGLTFGLGCSISFKFLRFDYAFNMNSLFNNHIFGLTFTY